MSTKSVVSRISSAAVQTSGKEKVLAAFFTSRPVQIMHKIYRKVLYYPQIGLYRDDCTKRNFYAPGVLNEAVQRLPDTIQRERQFRISRAFAKSGNKTVMNKKQWTLYNDMRYIDNAIDTVIRDIEVKRYWDQNGEQPPDDFKLSPEEYQEALSKVVGMMEAPAEAK
ncbi:cytochrome b-c1 complex subunit 7-like [Pecten maximus]|uniref:cytochrome b-c1 complex subunit 7-like n=1 Tax=Pecten maximus TaxID=6579 RepID=UPI001458457D|nr:cytochrome b-c1 complex subunit 7-like [Pecten maximus]